MLASLPAPAAARTYSVTIDKMKFAPVTAKLRVGDRIVWVNRDMFQHSATAADHSFDVDLRAGAKGVTVLRRAGTTAFSCKYHPGMRGVLHVAR